MNKIFLLVGVILLWTSTSSAQSAAADAVNAPATAAASDIANAPATAASSWPSWQPNQGFVAQPAPAVLIAQLLPSAPPLAAGARTWAPMPIPAPAEPPQGVQGVFAKSDWQVYAGYAFVRFYETPNSTINENGIDFSGAYYFRNWIAADGEVVATFASPDGVNSTFVMAAGGPRLRWSMRRGPEVWVHALVGEAHATPQTPFGTENGFGFETGGGIDIHSRHQRIAYRLQADLAGTRFFSTYQYSPKISVGIVYKF